MRLCINTKLHHCLSKALQCILGGLLLLAPGFIDCFCFNKVRSTSTLNNLNVTSEIYLFSLRWPDDTLKFSKAVKDVWRWKDSVLGDGRDFFVPKPKTLTALNRHLVDSCDCIGECSVFSNCARFEVLVWCPERIDSDVIRNQVSQTLAAQVQAHRNRTTFSILQDQIARFDSPKSIHVHALPCNDDIIVKEINNHWDVFSGVQVICHHLALVAAGMATRPNRPDKLVSFRPFSSRDAHILLQLKRTPTEGNRIKLLIDAALAAGKAARDPKQVPELKSLIGYGSGDNSKYSMDPPYPIMAAAAQAAIIQAIDPTVLRYVERWNAMQMSDRIAQLRQGCERLVQTDAELQWVRKELHPPTMDLRQGLDVNIESVIAEIETKLKIKRVTCNNFLFFV